MKFQAQFVSSALKPADCPRWERIEVAIAGRSNVGKSLLINALTGAKHLARTSKTPGRTRALNFFSVGDNLALVDLPGYGYAKMSHFQARRSGAAMREYLERRRGLVALAMLIDARRGPEDEEVELAQIARRRGLELIVVATKSDKLGRSRRASSARKFEPLGVEPLWCSAVDGEGIEALRRRILALARVAGV